MKDTDYTLLLLTVWLAPVAAKDGFIWYVMLALFFVMAVVAEIKGYYQKKLARLQAEASCHDAGGRQE